MVRGHWRYIAAAVGLTALVVSGQAQENEERARGDDQSTDEQTVSPVVRVVLVEDEAEAQTAESREKEAHQNQTDDLAAQQVMASATKAMNEATQRMALYACLQTFLVGIGTALLIWNLIQTRSMTIVTRKIGQAQVRAYLEFRGGRFELGEYITFKFVVSNIGQSPAKFVRADKISAMIVIEGEPQTIHVVNPPSLLGSRSSKDDLPASIGLALDPEVAFRIINASRDSRVFISITGRFEWTDVFDIVLVQPFRASVNKGPDQDSLSAIFQLDNVTENEIQEAWDIAYKATH